MRVHRLFAASAAVGLLGICSTAMANPTNPMEAAGSTDKDTDEVQLPGPMQTDAGIINGEDASRDDYPMTGGLLIDTTMSFGGGGLDVQTFMCSSTLIAPDVVLIAAHCVDPFALTFGFGELEDTEYVWSREADLSTYDGQSSGLAWPDDAVVVRETVMHPDWDMQSLQVGLSLNYDIALIFLEEPVLDVPPALLPSPAEAATLALDLDVAVVGWGQQEHVSGWGAQPPPGTYMIKQQGMSHIADIADFEFQVGAEEDDVRKCHGDSGGPSFAWVGQGTEETMRLVGVTSHAYDSSDCESKGGVDTRVDYFLDWIDDEMRSRCADGSRVWCEEEGILPTDYFEPDSEVGDTGDTGLDGDGDGDGGGDDGDSVDGDGEGTSKGGCSTVAGALSGMGLLVSMVAVGRRRA